MTGQALAIAAQVPPSDEQDQESTTSIERYIQWFEDSEDATNAARKASERDRDYFDHKQLTAEEKAALDRRGQPDVIVNRIHSKINYLKGYEAQNRGDPKAFPRNPKDDEGAEAATDALRYVADDTDLGQTFSGAWENILIEGYGGIELTIEERPTGVRDIVPVLWDWDRLGYDPHSRKPDFSDARYLFGVVWMDTEDAKAMWPDKEDIIERTVTEDETSTYADRPDWQRWTSGKGRKRVRIVQMYHKEGRQWWVCKFTRAGKLESAPVPFVDEDENSFCPLMMASAFVDRKNNRYGIVRQMISPQDEINKRRSKALHRASMRQVRSERGAVDDVDMAKAELAKPDGWVETNPGFEFEILKNEDQLAAEFQLLTRAMNDIDLVGPNAVMQGQGSESASGRAKQLDTQGGQIEITPLLDRHRHLKKRVFEGIWHLIRMYWDQERWVRVTDDENNVRFVGFNRPVTVADELQKQAEAAKTPPEDFQTMMAELSQDPIRGPLLGEVLRIENNPLDMHMDITIEEVPDVANVQEEQFQALTSLAPAVVFPPQVYIRASMLRNKSELIEIVEADQNDPAKQKLNATVTKLNVEKLAAEVDKLKSEALKARIEADVADAQLGAIQDPRILAPGGGGAMPQLPANQNQSVSTPVSQPGF